jgi:ribosomal-protein-serine acetyltransferase
VLTVPRGDGSFELRPLEEPDAGELYALIDRHRAHLARWLPWAQGQTPAAAVDFIGLSRRQHAEGSALNTAIVVDGAIAGIVGVHAVNRLHLTTSIGYWLSPEHEGRGLMTRAVRAYADTAFGSWGMHRMELRAAVENARSRAVAERLGFVSEGIAREAELVGSRRLDLVVYAVLAPEWRSATIAE